MKPQDEADIIREAPAPSTEDLNPPCDCSLEGVSSDSFIDIEQEAGSEHGSVKDLAMDLSSPDKAIVVTASVETKTSDSIKKAKKKVDKVKTRLKDVSFKIHSLKAGLEPLRGDVQVYFPSPDAGDAKPYRGPHLKRDDHTHRDRVELSKEKVNICPKANPGLYIELIEELLRLDEGLARHQDRIKDHLDFMAKTAGNPRRCDSLSDKTKRFYITVVDTFHQIKKKLTFATKDKMEYDRLIAALEVVGTILMMPSILTTSNFQNDRIYEPTIMTEGITTAWTGNQISSVSWPPDDSGLTFHYVKRDKIRFNGIENSVVNV